MSPGRSFVWCEKVKRRDCPTSSTLNCCKNSFPRLSSYCEAWGGRRIEFGVDGKGVLAAGVERFP